MLIPNEPELPGRRPDIEFTRARTVLTPQRSGFLASGPYPFTHSLSPFVGCRYGQTACGRYCYAAYLMSSLMAGHGRPWGGYVRIKENAPDVLCAELRALDARRAQTRVFFAPGTEVFTPLPECRAVSHGCLEAFTSVPDLDLLIVQTRSPLARDAFPLLQKISYAVLSMTIETDDQAFLDRLGGGPRVAQRFATIRDAAAAGIATQIVVSPCLPYSTGFAAKLLESGARLVVDTLVDGDGTGGRRTAHSPYARLRPDWADRTHALALYEQLKEAGAEVGWSAEGFCGIPPRAMRELGPGPGAERLQDVR